MARQIDPAIQTILKGYNLNPKGVLWDCHGTWCMYHRAVEKVAAELGIEFDEPLVIEANGAGKSVAICVTGHYGDKREWSIGEAAPGNNKNSYPYAMAEKRAKDRVVLKLIGLHGLVYSEDEVDEPAPAQTKTQEPPVDEASKVKAITSEFDKCKSSGAISECWARLKPNFDKLTDDEYQLVRDYATKLKATFSEKEAA